MTAPRTSIEERRECVKVEGTRPVQFPQDRRKTPAASHPVVSRHPNPLEACGDAAQ